MNIGMESKGFDVKAYSSAGWPSQIRKSLCVGGYFIPEDDARS